MHVWLAEKLEVMVVPTPTGIRIISSLCPHMGAQLRWNKKNDTAFCPWHGLEFKERPLRSCHERYRQLSEFTGSIEGNELVVYETHI